MLLNFATVLLVTGAMALAAVLPAAVETARRETAAEFNGAETSRAVQPASAGRRSRAEGACSRTGFLYRDSTPQPPCPPSRPGSKRRTRHDSAPGPALAEYGCACTQGSACPRRPRGQAALHRLAGDGHRRHGRRRLRHCPPLPCASAANARRQSPRRRQQQRRMGHVRQRPADPLSRL